MLHRNSIGPVTRRSIFCSCGQPAVPASATKNTYFTCRAASPEHRKTPDTANTGGRLIFCHLKIFFPLVPQKRSVHFPVSESRQQAGRRVLHDTLMQADRPGAAAFFCHRLWALRSESGHLSKWAVAAHSNTIAAKSHLVCRIIRFIFICLAAISK